MLLSQYRAVPLLMSTLSVAERKVLMEVCQGQLTCSIAKKKDLSEATIFAQRSSILRKMAAKNAVQLVYLVKSAKLHRLNQLIYKYANQQNQPKVDLGLVQLMPSKSLESGFSYHLPKESNSLRKSPVALVAEQSID